MCSRQGEGLTVKDSRTDECDKQDALMNRFDSILSTLQLSENEKVTTQNKSLSDYCSYVFNHKPVYTSLLAWLELHS